jgi:hypothetical protein
VACGVTRMVHSFLRVQPQGAPLPQHLNRRMPVDQLTALSLRKARRDVSRYSFAIIAHPVLKFELFTDNGERVVQDLASIPICTGSDGPVDQTLMFGLQINRHERLRQRIDGA